MRVQNAERTELHNVSRSRTQRSVGESGASSRPVYCLASECLSQWDGTGCDGMRDEQLTGSASATGWRLVAMARSSVLRRTWRSHIRRRAAAANRAAAEAGAPASTRRTAAAPAPATRAQSTARTTGRPTAAAAPSDDAAGPRPSAAAPSSTPASRAETRST